MGALLSSLCTRCINLWFRLSKWLPYRPWWAGSPYQKPYQKPPRDVEKGERKGDGPTSKRRALLVGIQYATSPEWPSLDGPYGDVDRFLELLISTYGYSPEDIVVLKDNQDYMQPTYPNVIRKLKQLVSGAVPGDRFTFYYSGHSDLQPSLVDLEDEEDGYDKAIVTCDSGRINDTELKYTLVKGLPVGCSLLAIFDTSHSGTMLNLPHHHCNNVYVPWISKGNRRTKTMHNKIVRGNAFDLVGLSGSACQQSTSVTRINTETCGDLSANQHEMSVKAGPVDTSVLSPIRCESPISSVKCDGWCRYDLTPRATVVSLSACSDLQRAWEGPKGSLTTVLCNFLKKQHLPSYRTVLSHINFESHDNHLALHEYTRQQRKKGSDFDGELNNFQAPQLSSLAKLNMDDIFRL